MTSPTIREILPSLTESDGKNQASALYCRLARRRRVASLVGLSTKVVTVLVVLTVPAFLALLIQRSWPLLSSRPITDLLFGLTWLPSESQFGFLPFLTSSLWVTILSLVISVPISILGASYLSEYIRPEARYWIKALVEILAGIPSVVYGLWGLIVIVPIVRWFASLLNASNTTGYSILSASLVLSVMVVPFLLSLSEEVFRTVPRGTREAALALGATRWEMTRDVVWRQTKRGLLAVIVLSFGRAFGETLAVLMVVGNISQIPLSPFDSGYPLPALIANNFGEMMSIPLYDAALMTAALILFVIMVLFNFGARVLLWSLERRDV
jgi:phosphate transport system permease protein